MISSPDDLSEELMRNRSLTRYEAHTHGSAGPAQPYRLSELAVVYLEAVHASPAAGYPVPAEHPRLNQTQMLFRPLVLAVLAGTTVDFPNNDDLFHNVFSYSQPREFDLGRYPRGQQRSIRFDTPGIVRVYCDIHSHMFATVLVLDHPYFCVPDDDGNFLIAGVPAGTYRVAFWYGRRKVASRPVTVEDGRTSSVNFEY